MSVTYNLGTDVGVARLIISDSDVANPIFQDEELAAFLSMENDNIKLGAAQALDTIATNEALTQKAIKILDLTTDGPKLAVALRLHATSLRAQVSADEAAAEAGTDFDWAEMVENVSGERERLVDPFQPGAV